MTKKETQIQEEVFNCHRISAKVKIIRKIAIIHSYGGNDGKFTTSIDCDHKSECGIGISSGPSISYDWTKCIHPDLKQ